MFKMGSFDNAMRSTNQRAEGMLGQQATQRAAAKKTTTKTSAYLARYKATNKTA